MGVFDSVGKWFEGESKSVQKATSNDDNSASINQELEALAEEERKRLEKEKQDYIDMFKPDDKDFVYKEYEGLSDEEIERLAKEEYESYYNDGKSTIESEYSEDINDADEDIENAENKSDKDSEIVSENLEDDVIDFRDSAYVKGILDSSIVGSKNTELDGLASEELDKIIAGLEHEIKLANDLKAEAEKEKLESGKKLESSYNGKVDGNIKSQTSDREKEKEKVEKYNKATTKEQEEFEKYKLDIADQKGKDYDTQLQAELKKEARYGYSGDRATHYNKRVESAKAYYDKFDKDEVLDMIKSNPALSELLGYEYNKFVRSYRNA